MQFEDLPSMTQVNVLSGSLVERVMVLWLIQKTGTSPFGVSQRQILNKFNRSNRETIRNYLKNAINAGILAKGADSVGIAPNTYIRGDFFSRRSNEKDRLIRLSNALWNPQKGLLQDWPYPSIWGYGCAPGGAVITLVVLRSLDRPTPQPLLRHYLSPLITGAQFREGVRWLKQRELASVEQGNLALSFNWQNNLEKFLQGKGSCNDRFAAGTFRRKRESDVNRLRVTKGSFTDAERRQLRHLPCVRKGCRRRAHYVEHFPARKYLSHLSDQTNRHLVWAICELHNAQMSAFIKSMPDIKVRESEFHWEKENPEQLRIYEAIAEVNIRWYYRAFDFDDRELAAMITERVLSAWEALRPDIKFGDGTEIRASAPPTRRRVGSKPYHPGDSKLHSTNCR